MIFYIARVLSFENVWLDTSLGAPRGASSRPGSLPVGAIDYDLIAQKSALVMEQRMGISRIHGMPVFSGSLLLSSRSLLPLHWVPFDTGHTCAYLRVHGENVILA